MLENRTRGRRSVVAGAVAAFLLIHPTYGESQTSSAVRPTANAASMVLASPVPPDVITRDPQGRVTLRATRLSAPLVLDGRLDDEVYSLVPGAGDFIQQEPHEGQPVTDKTEIWVFFDNKNVYVSARMWYLHPETIVANEMRRDGQPTWSTNDNLGVLLDTFNDDRSGFYLNTNALGAVRDALLTDEERNANLDFNLVWDVRSRRFSEGWTTEMVIPFKSLRYPKGREQVWGFNVQRVDRGKNEFSYLTPMPASYGGTGIWRPSAAATLVGLEAPPAGGGNFELKPYALSSVTTDRQARPALSNDPDAAFGFDAKYKITKSLNADFTYNTDFAQVEVDSQQVNLTRFSLFYPEKREFFLEGQNTFAFGGAGGQGGGGGAPILFFSRRIGLSAGVPVSIAAGGRLLGRVGPYTVGLISVRTKESVAARAPSTTFSVVRIRRDVLRRSAIGIIATDRAPSEGGPAGSNQVLGVDTTLALFRDVVVNAYYARSRTPVSSADDSSYRGQLRYNGDRYGAEADHVKVGPGFNPEVGFLARTDYVRNYAFGRFSPRPKRLSGVRKVSWEASVEDITGTTDGLQTRTANGTFRIFAENGDDFSVQRIQTEDRPKSSFSVARAPISAGSYQFGETKFTYGLGPQRPVFGSVSVSRGSFYGGHKTEISYNGRVSPTTRFMVEPNVTFDWLQMPQGDFTARLVSARSTFTVTPRMSVGALVQFNSTADALGTNVRFRWEYQPGSDFFVVYSDGRDANSQGFPGLLNRSVAIKFTRLFRS